MLPRLLKIPVIQKHQNIIDETFKSNESILYRESTLSKENLVYLLFLLRNLQYSYHKNGSCFPLHKATLRKTFLSRYSNYIDFLEVNNILTEVYVFYKPKESSKLYSLSIHSVSEGNKKSGVTYTLRNKKFIQNIFELDVFKHFNIKKLDEVAKKKNNYCKRVRPHLVKHFNDNLEIDIDQAYKQIGRLGEAKFFKQLSYINQFAYKDWRYSIKPETDNRLYTPIALLKKDLLPFLKYKKKELAEIDVKTSQPLFLLLVFKFLFYEKEQTLLTNFLISNLGTDLINKIKQVNIDDNEFLLYENLIVNEGIYSYFATKLDFNYDKSTKIYSYTYYESSIDNRSKKVTKTSKYKRDLVKIVFMKLMYGKIRNDKNVVQVANTFPSFFKVIDIINNHDKNHITKNRLSNLLQNLEAYTVLDLIAKDIYDNFKNLPLFSKHDSLITYKTKILEVKDFANQKFSFYTNSDITPFS